MPSYAVHNGSVVTNVIIADSLADAENMTGQETFEATPTIGIGSVLIDGVWTPPRPYPSWQFIDGRWSAPLPYPDFEHVYIWNEATVSWIEQITE